MSAPKATQLVQGVDYYMEQGKLVFTSRYHLKRGFCCNHRCRHCPYGESAPSEVITISGLPMLPSIKKV